MTREGKRPFAAFVVAVLVAALLAACGGSDSDSSSSTEATTSATTTAQNDGGAKEDSQGQNGDREQSGSERDRSQGQQIGGGNEETGRQNVATPLKVSGGGSEQFRVEGGDNSIQEYGEESDESELQEVAEIVHGFYVARAEERWDAACSYLAKSNVEQLRQLASQSPEFKNAGCGEMLKAFTRPLPVALQREITTVDAGSFRHDSEQGFLVYYGADHTSYAMPLYDEDGTWKVAALSAAALD